MTAPLEYEYALLAGDAYFSTRNAINRFPIPKGWSEDIAQRVSDEQTGFEARTFTNGTEIVISYAGTDPSDISGDIAADLALASGNISVQLKQAADYYLQIKAANPGATISFTGHSLGGGLASLMAVMFGESATTFDQAPFLNSAKTFTTTDAQTGATSTRSVAKDLRTYLTERAADDLLAKLDAYIAASDPSNPAPDVSDTLAGRSTAVSNINTQGEFLSSWFLVPSSNRIGSQTDISNSNNVSGLDLHSQTLLTAFLQSQETATNSAQTLSKVTVELPDLLKLIFDSKLYAYSTDKSNTTDPNFLELIVNHQAGRDPRTSSSITPDAMVTRFTTDLWKLAQDGGMTLHDGNTSNADLNEVSKALMA